MCVGNIPYFATRLLLHGSVGSNARLTPSEGARAPSPFSPRHQHFHAVYRSRWLHPLKTRESVCTNRALHQKDGLCIKSVTAGSRLRGEADRGTTRCFYLKLLLVK